MNIIRLAEIGNAPSSEVGKKAIMLSELEGAGFPVPPAFVIPAETFRKFVVQTGINASIGQAIDSGEQEAIGKIGEIIFSTQLPDYIKEEVLHAYESLTVSEELVRSDTARNALAMIKGGREPPYIAVRNSSDQKGSAVIGAKGAKQVIDAIKACWCSYFREASQEQMMHALDKGVAVVVQKLVNAAKCGIAFSSNPDNPDEVKIEAGWGLGDVVETRSIEPDVYTVAREGFNVIDRRTGNQDWMYVLEISLGKIMKRDVPAGQGDINVLTDFEAQEIAKLAMKAEEELGAEVKMEFAIERGKVHLLGFKTTAEPEAVQEEPMEGVQPEPIEEAKPSYPKIVTEMRVMLSSLEEANGLEADGTVAPFEIMADAGMAEPGREHELSEALYGALNSAASSAQGKPVWYRTMSTSTYGNPLLGWRGVRRSLEQKQVLKAELGAVKRLHDSGLTNIGLMLPLVTNVEQLRSFKSVLFECGMEAQENIDMGIAIDTPAAVQIIDELCAEGLDFIFIDVNSLAQLTFAADMSDSNASKAINRIHPALLRQVSKVIKSSRRYNTEVAMFCDSEKLAEFAVEGGVDIIVAPKQEAESVRDAVARREKKLLLRVARKDLEV